MPLAYTHRLVYHGPWYTVCWHFDQTSHQPDNLSDQEKGATGVGMLVVNDDVDDETSHEEWPTEGQGYLHRKYAVSKTNEVTKALVMSANGFQDFCDIRDVPIPGYSHVSG